MPNGGEHYERLGVCPLCGSPSIRIRRRRHRRLLWRCRRCNRVFGTPKVAECIIPPGHDGSGLVHAESIPQMEQRSRQHASRGNRFFRRSFSRKATALAVLVLLLGGVSYLILIAELGRDSGGIDQRPSVNESLAPTGLQSPAPSSTPPVTKRAAPPPDPTAAAPVATSTPSPSPTTPVPPPAPTAAAPVATPTPYSYHPTALRSYRPTPTAQRRPLTTRSTVSIRNYRGTMVPTPNYSNPVSHGYPARLSCHSNGSPRPRIRELEIRPLAGATGPGVSGLRSRN